MAILPFDLNKSPSKDVSEHDANQEEGYRNWDLNLEYFEEDNDYHGEDDDNGSDNDDVNVEGGEGHVLSLTNIHEENGTGTVVRNRRRFLTDNEREKVYRALLERSNGGKLRKHTTTEVSNLLSVPLRTVQRIWNEGKNNDGNVKNKKKNNCGRKKIQVDLNRIMNLELKERTTLRILGANLGVNYSTLHRILKDGLIRRHSNTLKPHLKEENKRARLQFCLSMLDPNSMPNEPKFMDMYNVVHIDEKWFYMTKKTEKYYLLPMEADPLRTCQSKNFIGKVMFLVAMARPRFDEHGNETFSGKIGVFPLVTKEPAIRRSRNREAGTLVTKPIASVTREVIKTFLIEKVIPSIQASWPLEDSRSTIYIQQDNARTHIDPQDQDFQRAATQNGFDIRLMCQPPNSPDLNILDFGFFSAIQSLQQKKKSNNVDELIVAVEKSFEEYSTVKINRTWVTLQLCMNEIMKNEGSNRYKIPHINKARLEALGELPKQITCDPVLVHNVMNQLQG